VKLVVPETITTERLVLRKPKASDAPAVYEYGRDPEVARYMDWPRLASLDEAIASTERALRRWDSGAEYTWRITVRPDDIPIGAVACRVSGRSADLGFVLARPQWGKGFATEAARAVFDWASKLEGVDRVRATCDVDNVASARVLERIGMSREGILRRAAVRPNLPSREPRDVFVYVWSARAEENESRRRGR
jgi:[ribosomal protein S5]-alanine N-acetyltransferase